MCVCVRVCVHLASLALREMSAVIVEWMFYYTSPIGEWAYI